MISPEYLFDIGNILFLIASYPLIKEAYKNKSSLKGFSLYGATLTFGGMVCMVGGFILMKAYLSALLAIPTVLFWMIVAYYKVRETSISDWN